MHRAPAGARFYFGPCVPGAAQRESGAPLTRDRYNFGIRDGPGSAAHRFALRACAAPHPGHAVYETLRRGVAGAHQADGVQIGLLERDLGGAFAHLVALVEQLDLLQFLEGFRQGLLGVVELGF
jgi:hypothetical protein